MHVAPQPEKKCGFLSLPTEIRDIIYEYILTNTYQDELHFDAGVRHFRKPPRIASALRELNAAKPHVQKSSVPFAETIITSRQRPSSTSSSSAFQRQKWACTCQKSQLDGAARIPLRAFELFAFYTHLQFLRIKLTRWTMERAQYNTTIPGIPRDYSKLAE
jgi:hypothetical protein